MSPNLSNQIRQPALKCPRHEFIPKQFSHR
jgi:hypothetical protein